MVVQIGFRPFISLTICKKLFARSSQPRRPALEVEQWGGRRGNPGPTVVLANTTYSNQGRQAHAALSVKLFRTQKVKFWSYIDLAASVVRRRLPGWHSTTHLVGSDFSASVTDLLTSDALPASTNPGCFSRPTQPLLQPRLLREDVAPSGYPHDCPS